MLTIWKILLFYQCVINEYRKNVNAIIKHTIAEYADQVDRLMMWALIKVRIKNISVKYC